MISNRLMLGTASLLAIFAARRAVADPLDVTNAATSPVSTAAASNASAGNVTVESAGSIIVTGTQPAVTINSSNSVTNGGTIGSSAATGATAVLIDGTVPITTTLANNGTISITGTGGSGNYGIRLMNGPVSGAITSAAASTVSVLGTGATGVSIESAFTGDVTLNSVSVTGDNSKAIALTAPVTGKFRLTGSTSASGNGDVAVYQAADIGGSFVNAAAISVGATSTSTTDSSGNAVTGPAVGGPAAVSIGGNIGGGFVNDLFYTDANGALVATASATSADTETVGTITGFGGSPAVLVAPANASNIVLSPYGAAGTDDGYGFVNRGTIVTQGNTAGLAATAIEIQGTTIGGVLYTSTLANGLINQSTARITSTTSGAQALAIEVGAGGIVPAIVNKGAILATDAAATGGVAAIGIKIDAGGQVGSIANSGSIEIKSSAAAITGYGILDQSGSVASITNSGTITVDTGTAGSALRAIDLSAGTAAQTVTNSGTIAGDILFGSGGGHYVSNSGSFTGTLSYGAGPNLLTLTGTTAFANPVTVATGGSLGVSLADTSSLRFTGAVPTLSTLSAAGQSIVVLDVSSTSSALQVTGAASFTGQSLIKLNILQPGSQTLTVLSAAGGITTDHAATLLGSTSTPYLYTLSGFTVNANTIQVTLHQRTAAEAGFALGIAPLYTQTLTALSAGGTAFDAIASLPDQASVLAAFRQITPPSYGTALARVADSVQTAGFGTVAGRMNAISMLTEGEIASGSRLGLWIEEGGEFLRHRDAQDDPGFKSNGFLLDFGADYRLGGGFLIGAAASFAWTDLTPTGVKTADGKPLTNNVQMIDLYASWTRGPFYLQGIASVGHDSYRSRRTITIGDYSADQTAHWNGRQLGGALIAGGRFHIGRITIEPSDTFSYLQLHQGKYTETGADALDLSVGSQQIKLATNTGKLAVGYDLPLAGGTLSISGRGAYISRIQRTIDAVDAQFAGGGDPFTLTSAPLGRSEKMVGTTVGYHMQNFLFALSGDRRHESGFNATSVSAMLRVTF